MKIVKISEEQKIKEEWISPDINPPKGEDYGSFNNSIDVLITDGKKIYMGYLQTYEENEHPSKWKLSGRDSYDAEFPVIGWTCLPNVPIPKGPFFKP